MKPYQMQRQLFLGIRQVAGGLLCCHRSKSKCVIGMTVHPLNADLDSRSSMTFCADAELMHPMQHCMGCIQGSGIECNLDVDVLLVNSRENFSRYS